MGPPNLPTTYVGCVERNVQANIQTAAHILIIGLSFARVSIAMAEKLTFPAASAALLEAYLPPATPRPRHPSSRPFVTLTFATSLDSSLSLAPGVRTRLSGPESKAMTHYLRSRHAAILVGVGTVLADDPALNCRIAGVERAQQPRPVVVDTHGRWVPRRADKVLQTCRRGDGLAPYVLTAVPPSEVAPSTVELLREHGGKLIHVGGTYATPEGRLRLGWHDILGAVLSEGLASVMVEGGGRIINSLLAPPCQALVDAVVVTVAPTWLGRGGVVVSPDRVYDGEANPVPAARLTGTAWLPFGEDVVLCGRLLRDGDAST